MKKWFAILAAVCIMWQIAPMHSDAATIKSGADYVPSKNYFYEIYFNDSYNSSTMAVKCSGPVSQRECTNPNGGYTHLYKNHYLSLGIASSDYFLMEDYYFPMKSNTIYTISSEDEYGDPYKYKYTVLNVNMTKKVGNRTYKHVIRIKNNASSGYTYIAKNHGVILITYKQNGKQKIFYKVKNYTRR